MNESVIRGCHPWMEKCHPWMSSIDGEMSSMDGSVIHGDNEPCICTTCLKGKISQKNSKKWIGNLTAYILMYFVHRCCESAGFASDISAKQPFLVQEYFDLLIQEFF